MIRSDKFVVSQKRWREAQNFELNVWKRQNARWYKAVAKVRHLFNKNAHLPGDDWNGWWLEQFAGYAQLPQEIDNAIELGCGPYTNMRLICANRSINYVMCSDPLALDYIKFKGQWLAESHKQGAIIVDNHPLEDCPYATDYFDLVVLINVLDHVQDARVSIEHALRIVKTGGYFVFGQDLTDDEDIRNTPEDVGHPIRLHHTDIDQWLNDSRFDIKLHKLLSREEGRNPTAHYGTYVFIGRKK